MKYFLAAFALCTVSATASAQTCSSIWIFKAWKSCAVAAHGLDTSAPGVSAGVIELSSDWYGGNNKPTQEEICKKVEAKYNAQNKANGQLGVLTKPTPVNEHERRNGGIYVERQYVCQVASTKYPFISKASRACGEEDKVSYKVGGSKADVAGDALCLSCDEYANPKSKVACLKLMITDILNVEPKPVDVRDSDLQAVSKATKGIMDMAKVMAIDGLSNDVNAFSLLNTFLEKNPVR